MRNVLVLGAGLVARPLLHYLLTHHEFRLLVATANTERASQVMGEHPRGRVVEIDVRDSGALAPLVAEADAVVSLLPAELNPLVARECIAARRPLVNTSYTSPAMRALDGEATAAGVLLLNEMGLDPGIDHMSAVATLRRIRFSGGVVTQFSSCCGGFPALDANTNPWGYKFSWSPRAVMLAGRNRARYLRAGEAVEIPGPELFAHSWPLGIDGLGVFEIYPNRDSLDYVEPYGLGAAVDFFRGTLRYPGWCATMLATAQLGLLDIEVEDWPEGMTYRDLLTRRVPGGSARGATRRVAEFLALDSDSEVVARLEWAGLFSDRPLPALRASPLDLFGKRLERMMMYQPGERDLVAMQHVVTVAYPDGSQEEVRASLVAHGDPWGDTAMARTVSLTAGIATRLILERGFQAVGVQIPTLREIYEPVLEELADRGIALYETRRRSFHSPFAV
ncbi:MAG: saccharopine dehydrogenase C-terminal domain-containing protein [Thermoanaerobaculia bacterium]